MLSKGELEEDYIKRWGNAQKCYCCGFVMAYGEHNKLQACCGAQMKPVREILDRGSERMDDLIGNLTVELRVIQAEIKERERKRLELISEIREIEDGLNRLYTIESEMVSIIEGKY